MTNELLRAGNVCFRHRGRSTKNSVGVLVVTLTEASFDVAKRLAARADKNGGPVPCVTDLYALHQDAGSDEVAIWFDVFPVADGDDDFVLVEVNARELLNLSREEILAAFMPRDDATRH